MDIKPRESKTERITLTCTPAELVEIDFLCAYRHTDRATLLRGLSLDDAIAEARRLREILNTSAA